MWPAGKFTCRSRWTVGKDLYRSRYKFFQKNTCGQVSGDTLRNWPSQTITPLSHPLSVTLSVTVSVRHIFHHILCLSHCPLHHPVPPTLSVHFTFPHITGNSIPLNDCISMSISVISPSQLHHTLHHGIRHISYHCVFHHCSPLPLFFYIYNLVLILAEVLSYSFRTSLLSFDLLEIPWWRNIDGRRWSGVKIRVGVHQVRNSTVTD